MALPEILLIDDSFQRLQLVEAVFKFMECGIATSSSAEFESFEFDSHKIDASFVHSDSEALPAFVKRYVQLADRVPLYLIVEKDVGQPEFPEMEFVAGILEWPTVLPVLSELLDGLHSRSEVSRKPQGNKGLAGKSQAIQGIRNLIDQVARSDATVLILGESGTGKEVVAQALHRASPRKDNAFVPVNCGAIPGELLESELFGHEKGAFTGALSSRQGRFEMAEGGTLFLDEIGDMPMPMQVKLLRVLQERSFERVGSNKTIHCNVRIIAATHRQLEQEIVEKRFREDLFYRLNVFPIEVPALRDRVEDIPYLINDLILRMEANNRGSVRLTQKAIAVLMQHHWPGNVRELSNFIERLAIIHPDGVVDVVDLPEKFKDYHVPDSVPFSYEQPEDLQDGREHGVRLNSMHAGIDKIHLPEQGIDLKEYLTELENELIRQALDECNGVVAHAAKLLNMRRTTLVEKLRKVEV